MKATICFVKLWNAGVAISCDDIQIALLETYKLMNLIQLIKAEHESNVCWTGTVIKFNRRPEFKDASNTLRLLRAEDCTNSQLHKPPNPCALPYVLISFILRVVTSAHWSVSQHKRSQLSRECCFSALCSVMNRTPARLKGTVSFQITTRSTDLTCSLLVIGASSVSFNVSLE